MNKKGDVTDTLVFVITVFIISTILLVFAYFIPQLAGGLRGTALNNSAEGANAINQLSNMGTNLMQRGLLIILFGLILGEFITSWFTRVHPIFLVLYLFMLGISLVLGVYLSFAWNQFISNPAAAQMIASQTITLSIMNNLNKITLVTGALSMIIAFSRYATGGGEKF
jgi:RsiW-degrading membrane proteinase PrsW (M82 family)